MRIIDQTLLPGEFREIDLKTVGDVVEAIQTLRVRGAPAIGIAGAMGLVAALRSQLRLERDAFWASLQQYAARIRDARPTAANLGWAIDRLLRVAKVHGVVENGPLWSALRDEAIAILEEDRRMCRAIGEHGLGLLVGGATVLTHCNAGALATGGIGTALAPIYLSAERGVRVRVLATETRPLLQGSRLTAWELARAGIDVTLLTDGAASAAMRKPGVDVVIVGADRIVANGDVANKIGTYGLAVLAHHHGIPFYVAAPSSTCDFDLASGSEIPIEERSADEVRSGFGRQTAPDDVDVFGAAFDVTPAELIRGIITEHGIFEPGELGRLREAVSASEGREAAASGDEGDTASGAPGISRPPAEP